jgi:ribosomal protein L40E
MTALAPELERFASLRACHACRAPVPADAAACAKCGSIALPVAAEWPANLRWWLVWEHARVRFLPHLTVQHVWEKLLADSLNGIRIGTGPNPFGFTMSTPAVELLPLATAAADRWRAAGAPLDPSIDFARLERAARRHALPRTTP